MKQVKVNVNVKILDDFVDEYFSDESFGDSDDSDWIQTAIFFSLQGKNMLCSRKS